jgi:hypothetical protein
MKKNMGSTDRNIRIIAAVLIGIVYFSSVITGILGIVLLTLAGILVVTSFVGICPIYSLFGLNSCPIKKTP